MKNKNRILVYDDNCPLCAAYTEGFVRTGLLPREGRVAFSTVSTTILDSIDLEKSKNEIPLIDPSTNRAWYGIDALLEILGARFPWIKLIGKVQPINWILKKLYKLISYNRKVIVATKCGPGAIDCAPAFSSFYRILFMTIFLVFNTAMLIPIHNSILTLSGFYERTNAELQFAHLAFVGMNCLMASTLGKRKAIEYLGQVNMLALTSILLLIPLIIFNKLVNPVEELTIIYLALLTCWIIREYFRRMRFANIMDTRKVDRGCESCQSCWIFTLCFLLKSVQNEK